MTNTYANKYPGDCTVCGQRVEPRTGTVTKTAAGWSKPAHTTCPTAPTAAAAPAPATFTPTAEQVEVMRLFATGRDLVIEAGAGAAKTSTLVLCAQSAPHRTGQYVAFSKALVTESAEKFPGNVRVSTIHALAYAATVAQDKRLARRLKTPRPRSMDLARMLRLDKWTMTYGTETKTLGPDRLAGLVMRAVREFCTSGDPEPTARHIPYVEGIDLPDAHGNRTYTNNDSLRAHLLPVVRRAWADLSSPDGLIPWANFHGYYLKMWERSTPVILGDFLLVDEAQDVSGVMLSIIEQQANIQRVLVGDSAQAIFGFLGLVDALAVYRERGAQTARLSKSFRFGPAIADVANGLLDRLGADLRLTGNENVLATVAAIPDPDCILTRKNATAVSTCLNLLDEGRKPYLVGGCDDVVDFAKAALDLQAGRPTGHPDLSAFDTWLAVVAFVATDEQGEDLRLMVKLVEEFGAAAIIAGLSRTATAETADVVVSTAHKSKGKEWASVQLAGDFFAARDGGDVSDEEKRLLYVAVTRAKRELDLTMCPQAVAAQVPAAEPTALELTARYNA